MADKTVRALIRERANHGITGALSNQGTSQVFTHVDDPHKSIAEMIKQGKRLYIKSNAQNKHPIKNANTLPTSFTKRPTATKSRGSSADHSREGSSDDGSSRYTLSPTVHSQQHSSQQNLPNPYQNPFHARQGSAPAIMNSPAVRQMPTPAHVPSKSLSAVAMSRADDHFNAPSHRSAKSCDLNVASHLEMNYTPDGNVIFYDHPNKMAYMSDLRAKSQSLDPLAVGLSESAHLAPPQSMLSNKMQSPSHSIPVLEQDLPPLPDGWVKSYDPNGDPYFIDHNSQTTTWYDPRFKKEAQEDAIRQRHSCARNVKREVYGDYQQDAHPSLVERLQMERSYMQERQQQLCREGLLEPQGQPPYVPIASMHQQPVMTGSNAGYGPYCNNQPLRLPSEMMAPNYYGANLASQNVLPETTSDSAMEVDYSLNTPSGMMHPMNTHHSIEPIVRDLSAEGFNPHEFEQYLHLNDRPLPATTEQYM